MMASASSLSNPNFETIMIKKTENGILTQAIQETSFKKKLAKLREKKDDVYKRMEQDASNPGTQAHYANPANTFDGVDQEVIG